ncbi:type VII secretion system ESX-1 target EspB, partial [Mycobacterium tuberculosis]
MPAAPMVPPTGSPGGGLPADTAAQLTSAGREAAALSGDVAVKAASLGGGGGGGVPSAPLGSAIGGAESVRPAGAGDIAGLGQGRAGGGAALGGGGMGMPMGAAHQGQGGAKSKGSQQEDEALYTEDRAWTEAVIGNRRRQDSKESK